MVTYLSFFPPLFTVPPEIELERAWVHSGEGYEAQLVCIVDAQPTAEVRSWYFVTSTNLTCHIH